MGACRELIEGSNEEDRQLGRAGAVVPIANPDQTAAAAIGLLSDPQRWQACREAGIRRVERYYTQSRMFREYRKLYRHCLEKDTPRRRRA